MIHTWSPVWPTEPGYYWFYGFTSHFAEEKRLRHAEVRQARNALVYIVGGAFMYLEEGAVGMWMWIDPPELP